MRGDVLFWTPDGSPVSRAIALATKGPFCHVSVDLGDGTDIGAHADGGIQVRPLPPGMLTITPYHPAPTLQIERGIVFLHGEVGNGYGFGNIVNAGLKIVGIPYRISQLDSYDCSSLVTRYLEKIGLDTGDLGEEPDSVSPNDLARFLGLIK